MGILELYTLPHAGASRGLVKKRVFRFWFEKNNTLY